MNDLRTTLREWVDRAVAPYAASVDREARFPEEAWRSFVDEGWVRLQYPTPVGGTGHGAVAKAMLIEEMARGCASSSLVAHISHTASIPLMLSGNDDLVGRYLPSIACGAHQASFCLSEAAAGSDPTAMATSATASGSQYIVDGTKHWVTNAGVSSIYLTFASTGRSGSDNEISCFVVEAGDDVVVDTYVDKLGLRGSPTGTVTFDEVAVPAANMVGRPGEGLSLALRTLARTRALIGAQAVGIAQAALEAAATHLASREQFGRPLARFQGLQFMLAEMAAAIEAGRCLVERACRAIDEREDEKSIARRSAVAKLVASEAAVRVTNQAVELLGGRGYTSHSPVERLLRDAKATQIYEGTNQIQRLVIAKALLGNSVSQR